MRNRLIFFSEKINWYIITQKLKALNWEQLLENCISEAILDELYSNNLRNMQETCSSSKRKYNEKLDSEIKKFSKEEETKKTACKDHL